MTGNKSQKAAFCLSFMTSLYVAIVACCAKGSASGTKVVSLGSSVSLDCIVTQDQNVNIFWSKNCKNMANAGRLSDETEIGYLFPGYSEQRFKLNYTKPLNSTVSVFTITMWNITSEESSTYTCQANNYIIAYSCDVQVVNCACSVDSNIRCNLTGFSTQEWISVNVQINGNNSFKYSIRPSNKIVASKLHLGLNTNKDIDILVSSVENSQIDINVMCILPASDPKQVRGLTTSPPSPPTIPSPSQMTKGESTTETPTSSPTYQSISSTPETTCKTSSKGADDSLRATTSSGVTNIPETNGAFIITFVGRNDFRNDFQGDFGDDKRKAVLIRG